MRRVLVLTPDFPPAHGGIQLLVHRIVAGAPSLRCRVVTIDAPGAAELDAALDVRRSPALPGPRPLSTLALNAAAVREAADFRPHAILSAHLVVAPAAAAISRATGAPVVQYFYAKEIGVRPRLARFAARQADAVIAISDYCRELVLGVGGRAERIRLITPGVDLPAAVGQVGRDDRPTVLTIARMDDRYKGHDTMVRAMALVAARVPGARWVVIGDGSLRRVIAGLAGATGLGPETVSLLGRVDDAERETWLDRAHVFAMPSRLPAGGFAGEGFGIVYLEAGAHRCPAVAGGVGGAVDAIIDGETGLLVDPEDHLAVADALVELLGDPERRRRMGEAGARRAAELAWPRVAERVAALIAELTPGVA